MKAPETLQYRVVDVFTQRAMEGNSLAVFLDGSNLETQTMQRIARELNLSETVFLLPPSGSRFAARLRIFTPMRELAFAGHPTVGTAYVLLDEGIVSTASNRFNLEEEVGAVPILVDPPASMPLIWLTTPAIHYGPTRSRELCARVLGLTTKDLLPIEPQIVSAGNPTLLIPVRTREAVDQAWLEASGLREMRGDYSSPLCAFVFAPVPEGAYSRMFAPEYGIAEDPATGSSTGPLASFMQQHKLLPQQNPYRFVSEQGTKMGRRSILHVRINPEENTIEIGGNVTPLARGEMTISSN